MIKHFALRHTVYFRDNMVQDPVFVTVNKLVLEKPNTTV